MPKKWARHGFQESSEHCSKAGKRRDSLGDSRVGRDGGESCKEEVPLDSTPVSSEQVGPEATFSSPFSGMDNPTFFPGQQKG